LAITAFLATAAFVTGVAFTGTAFAGVDLAADVAAAALTEDVAFVFAAAGDAALATTFDGFAALVLLAVLLAVLAAGFVGALAAAFDTARPFALGVGPAAFATAARARTPDGAAALAAREADIEAPYDRRGS
jgi:hypothetical protein